MKLKVLNCVPAKLILLEQGEKYELNKLRALKCLENVPGTFQEGPGSSVSRAKVKLSVHR